MRVGRYTSSAFVALLLAGAACPAFAQDLGFAISPTPVGSGARAAGMADAFTGIADDATAASWNPAGLVQLETPELAIVGQGIWITDWITTDTTFDNDKTLRDSSVTLNFASLTYPIPVLLAGRNAVVSISYQQRYDLTRKLDVGVNLTTSFVNIFGDLVEVDSGLLWDFEQEGALGVITPAFAIELTHNLSIGVAVNLWRSSFLNDNSWNQTVNFNTETTRTVTDSITGAVTTSVSSTTRTTTDEYEDLRGKNVTLGLLWNVNPRWNLALRYDSAFVGNLDFKSTRISAPPALILVDGVYVPVPVHIRTERQKMSFPDTWTVAAAYRPYDKLTIGMQISRTDWNDFYIENEAGMKISLVDGVADDMAWHTKFDPTYTIRVGAEYVLIPDDADSELDWLWSLRGGLFYDQVPASGRSTFDPRSKGHGDPDDFYGVAAGVGVQAFNRVNVDFAYQLRYGSNVSSDRLRGLDGFEEDLMLHRVLFSTIIYF